MTAVAGAPDRKTVIMTVCAREWRDDRFLAIGVDEAATGASGCSIDGMFRVLASIESQLGTTLTGGNTLFWRDASGEVVAADRPSFRAANGSGAVTPDTRIFDLTVSSVADWRGHFEPHPDRQELSDRGQHLDQRGQRDSG